MDLGDTIVLAATCRDSSGQLADATTVTLTVTLPDGTTVEPSVANPPAEPGQYTHPYVSTQAGRHSVRWVFTGGVPEQAYADVFNAADPAWPALVGLAEVKDHLNIPPDNTDDDEELRGFILSASHVVEGIVGVCAKRTVTESSSGGERHIVLARSPVDSVTEVLADGELVDPGDYTSSPSGLVARRSGRWPAGLRNIESTYVVGRSVIPPNVLDGTKDLIRINWRPQQGGNYPEFDGGATDDFGVTEQAFFSGSIRLGFFVPNTVMQRLESDKQGPPVA